MDAAPTELGMVFLRGYKHVTPLGCGVLQLATFFLGPRIGTLIDRDDKLGRLFEKVEEFGFGGFHGRYGFVRSKSKFPPECFVLE